MNDTLTIVLASVCWPVFLHGGVVLTRLKREPWAFMAHILSAICLLGPLSAVMHWLGWTFETIGWWILVIIPAAIVINLILIVIAGNIWPHCKKCGAEMVPTNYEVGRGTEDQGYVTIATCPNKCPK